MMHGYKDALLDVDCINDAWLDVYCINDAWLEVLYKSCMASCRGYK